MLLEGNDCLCCLQTGYGKSLVYELLPFIIENCIVVVIEPLNAIIKQQLDKLGDRASVVTRGQKTENTNFLFGHQEDVL